MNPSTWLAAAREAVQRVQCWRRVNVTFSNKNTTNFLRFWGRRGCVLRDVFLDPRYCVFPGVIFIVSFILGNFGTPEKYVLATMQELGIPYKLLSTSEPHEPFRQFASVNHDSCHWHRTIGDQLKDAPCASHPQSVECKVADEGCHLLILGTPCNPFSTQRQKRFAPGSIMAHGLSTHTFDDAYQMLSKVKPVNCIFEQTEGFDKPFDTETTETPLQR